MSADNFLIIKGKKKFKAYMGDASSGHVWENVLFEADSAEDAIKKSQEYMMENIVEYGYHFSDL